MIGRLAIPVIVATLLAAFYFDRTSWRQKKWWQRLLRWLLPLAVVVCTAVMAHTPYYFPDQIYKLELWLTMVVVVVVPWVLVALGSFVGRLVKRRHAGELVGWCLSLLFVLVYAYGSIVGFRRLEVVHVEFAGKELPKAFDGYRIVQFSDAHVGTYRGERQVILGRAIDSINAQRPDLVVFTGDLQNKEPQEIVEHMKLLGSIKARDGVFSVKGNHDYTMYLDSDDPRVIARNLELMDTLQASMGWTLLNNDHRVISRDSSHIVIAGMENDGEGRFPQYGHIGMALQGVDPGEFVVMLEHDPTSWRRKILPQSHAQLTLSGHTHGGQLSLFGWSPASLKYSENCGLYRSGSRALYVSKGLGGVIPFRFGATGEIVVITLHASGPAD